MRRLTSATRLTAVNKDFAQRADEGRADAEPPEVKAECGVCLAR